ncbi:MAG: 4'-phosphopantetheinyl transferase superfamily protein [Clostridia bacterium]|nr:4'-phosphopantetheinyl transferase superfamily protein [Clostridia bacterium]
MSDIYIVKADNVDEYTFSSLITLLPDKEKQRILLKRDNQAKINSLVAAFLIRYIIKKKFNIPFDEITILRDGKGKPYIKERNDIDISISHSENIVACAVSKSPVGIDIQKIKEVSDSLIKRICSEEEVNEISNSSDPVSSFINTWTKKEAILKKKGTGILDKEIKTCLNNEKVCSVKFEDYWISYTI